MSNRAIANVSLLALAIALVALAGVVVVGVIRVETEVKLMRVMERLERRL